MLDELRPELWSEWMAFRAVEPDPWVRLIDLVRNIGVLLLNYHGINLEPEQIDPGFEAVAASNTGEALAETRARAEAAERLAQ
jgi:hypothetical protein